MTSRGLFVIPILFSGVFFLLGQNSVFQLSDPLDFMATGLGVIFGVIQIVIWILLLFGSARA